MVSCIYPIISIITHYDIRSVLMFSDCREIRENSYIEKKDLYGICLLYVGLYQGIITVQRLYQGIKIIYSLTCAGAKPTSAACLYNLTASMKFCLVPFPEKYCTARL